VFQSRVESTGLAQVIQEACNTVSNRLRSQTQSRHRTRAHPAHIAPSTPGYRPRGWTAKWVGGPAGPWDRREKKIVERDWVVRWRTETAKLDRPLRPGMDLGDRKVVLEDSAPTKDILRLHKELCKAESALLVRARTGRIGLARFLHSCKVPGLECAKCQCRAGEETPRPIALSCNR
jgi:hypothetical protein